MATEFITRTYGNKEFEIIVKTDSKEHYKAAEDFARRLIDHAKPKTNADRIRAMTDRELVEIIMCPYDSDIETCVTKGTCLDCCMEWLKQPAEVSHD